MHSQTRLSNSNRFTITLEVVPDDPLNADPALADAIGRDTIDALRNDGYTIEPVYTGQRGGFLVDVVVPVLTAVWAQKDVILTDGSALITIFTPVAFLAKCLHQSHERRVGKDAVQQSPIKITVEIDGASILIEAPDQETAATLAQRFLAQYPAIASQVTKQSKAKVKAGVAKRQQRKRR